VLLTIIAGAGTFFAYFQVQSFLNELWDRAENEPVRLQ
jgi:hypothetical protein